MNNLTQEEQELLNSVENGEWQSKPNLAERKRTLQQLAQEHLNEKEDELPDSFFDFERDKSLCREIDL